jgi:predicted  nucleic acid-binding Zn-ribbon protein
MAYYLLRLYQHRVRGLVPPGGKGEAIIKTWEKHREEYIDKMERQLKEWSARIDELESRVSATKTDAKMEYKDRIRELKDRRETLSRNLSELRESGGKSWEAMKAGIESVWLDFTDALTAAREKFRKAA